MDVCVHIYNILFLEAIFFLDTSKAMPKGASQHRNPWKDLPVTLSHVAPVLWLPSEYFHGKCLLMPKKECIAWRGIFHTTSVIAQA